MEFLGCWLSPTNSISLDSDKLEKLFYFRPDKYDDPDADLENILAIKAHESFPKRYDLLEENNSYAVDTIEVAKKLSNDDLGIEKVSFVVTAEYDLLTNILAREAGGEEPSDDSNESESEFDEDDAKVTKATPPWKLKAKFNWNYQEKQVPLLSGFNDYNNPTIPIVNTARRCYRDIY